MATKRIAIAIRCVHVRRTCALAPAAEDGAPGDFQISDEPDTQMAPVGVIWQ
jgi:hypothetical protein